MSVADKLTRLAEIKSNIKAAIIAKGQTVGNNMALYANAISAISSDYNITINNDDRGEFNFGNGQWVNLCHSFNLPQQNVKIAGRTLSNSSVLRMIGQPIYIVGEPFLGGNWGTTLNIYIPSAHGGNDNGTYVFNGDVRPNVEIQANIDWGWGVGNVNLTGFDPSKYYILIVVSISPTECHYKFVSL